MNSSHNLKPRPWPVNPATYPLSGPTRGPAYCPQAPVKAAARVAGFVYGLFR